MKDNNKTRRTVEEGVEEVDDPDSLSQGEPMGDLIADLKKIHSSGKYKNEQKPR